MSVVRGQAGPSHHSFRFYVSREIVACDTSQGDSTMRAALIYVVGSIAVFYLFYLFLH